MIFAPDLLLKRMERKMEEGRKEGCKGSKGSMTE